MRGVWFDQGSVYTVLSISYHDIMVSIAWRNRSSKIHVDQLLSKSSTFTYHLSLDIQLGTGIP